MADEFHLGSGNWWDTSRNRFDSGTSTQPAASISTTLNSIASLGWPTEMVDMKSTAASGGGSLAALHGGGHDQSSGGVLGLSSQGMDWNVQALLRGEKGGASPEDNDFKQINQGFSIDQPHFSSNDSSSTYGLLLLDQNQQQNNSYPYPYGVNTAEILPSWNKFPQLLRQSPPPLPFAGSGSSHLHFTNATPFWNPTAAVADARSSFPPPSQLQIPLAPSFDEKPKNTSEMRNLSTTTKKNSTETSNKRTRSETPSPMPAFKVRKEKMGDRITALQQLVSPFGKTDTASVLSEAIEYIKFLHEQVGALSAPYMKNGAPIQHQQNYEKSRDPEEHHRQDLRSRGLCLVPVSSTFPVTNETTVDFWTPTFGGSFR